MLSTKGSRYDLKRQAKRTEIPLIKDEMRGNLLDYVSCYLQYVKIG